MKHKAFKAAIRAAGLVFYCALTVWLAGKAFAWLINLLSTNYELAGYALAGGTALILFGIFFMVIYGVMSEEESTE